MAQSVTLSRRIRRAARKIPPLRALGYWRSDRKFRLWQKRNPGRSFADYYAADAERKIIEGKHHFTLGVRGWDPRDHTPVDWDEQSFARHGVEIWERILEFGLEPHMRCVDYGCGSLRLGQHAIRYLERGHYYGIDVVDTFINEGLRLIDPQLLKEKRPQLGVIDGLTLREVGNSKPDFIFSSAVLQHVPPAELPIFFTRLEMIMRPGTRGFILYVGDHRLKRVKTMNWAYPTDYLMKVMAAVTPSLKVDASDAADQLGTVDGRPRKVLRISQSGGDGRWTLR